MHCWAQITQSSGPGVMDRTVPPQHSGPLCVEEGWGDGGGGPSRVCRPSITGLVLPTQLSGACITPLSARCSVHLSDCSVCIFVFSLDTRPIQRLWNGWRVDVSRSARGVIWLKLLAQRDGCWRLMKLVGNERRKVLHLYLVTVSRWVLSHFSVDHHLPGSSCGPSWCTSGLKCSLMWGLNTLRATVISLKPLQPHITS